MYHLARMPLGDMAHASASLRKLGANARSMEEAARRVVRFLFDEFGEPEKNERGSVLVRLYKTHPFGDLPRDLQAFATSASGAHVEPRVPCLVLMGTAGVQSAWNSRLGSKHHRVIPLPSVDTVSRLPMVAQLVSQLGFDVASLVNGSSDTLLDRAERTFNVFHVPVALSCPYIPDQDFVRENEVRSVLGFGGQLPDGQMFAVILFARVEITRDTANTFKPLALATKVALLPFVAGAPLFDEEARVDGSA